MVGVVDTSAIGRCSIDTGATDKGIASAARQLSAPPQEGLFLGVAALLFGVSAIVTIVWSARMLAMEGMSMPGDWTMSMTWMRMPGQTWFDVALSFLGMWVLMMMAMMLPSLVPMLRRYRQAIGRTDTPRLGRLTLLVGTGYFAVWTLLGVAIFPLGVLLAALQMRYDSLAGAVPLVNGFIVLIAGALQFTRWKTHYLACCRNSLGQARSLQASINTAWQHGLRLGLRCCYCCAGLTTILLAVGVMNPIAMAVVTVAITAERLAPAGERIAMATGAVAVGAGLLMVVRAVQEQWAISYF